MNRVKGLLMGVFSWLHKRQRKTSEDEVKCPDELIQEAEERRREAHARWSTVNDVIARVHDQGRRNNFGETVYESYRRRHA